MDFPIARPEELGISSEAIARFVEHLRESELPMHSLLLIRHGRTAAEMYAKPFTADTPHRMYSISKSFVAVAVGVLVGDGALGLDDEIWRFFPEYCPAEPEPFLARTTVRDCLMMATPFPGCNYRLEDENWTRTFFTAPTDHPPGMFFQYNTGASVILNALVEKLTGMPLFDFLRLRVLDKLGFSAGAHMLERPEGGHWGGSAVLCTPRDLAALLTLLKNGGSFNGEQLVLEGFVREATSNLIDTRAAERDTEHSFGYGYQIWQTRCGGFAFNGMGGQFGLVLPDKDVVFVANADVQLIDAGSDRIINSFFTHIYPAIDGPAQPQPLRELTESFTLPTLRGDSASATAAAVNGRRYTLSSNPMGMTYARFDFEDGKGVFSYGSASGEHRLAFGIKSYIEQDFDDTRPYYSGTRINTPSEKPYRVAATGAWSCGSLVLEVYSVGEYLGVFRIVAAFRGGLIALRAMKAAEGFFNEYSGMATGRE